ncbi:hypothetical protein [Alkaliphilus hydrothermalis]|uniref:FecR protein domain-containing protein n=1 Tax=Alkaliphilus hydrothermalis TaxID=1482730 RepID=A0ABS2NMF3_9FIRM|nr:hypothetical protein [Alkaliphilus hydrothermalis]MBM7614096.1 hypothetical protein [Alkaliphilus hydrothermalis]
MKNKWITQLERVLVLGAVVLMLSVIGLNARSTLQSQQKTVLQINSKAYNLQSEISPNGEVVVKIDDIKNYPRLELLVNGVVYKMFGNEKEIVVEVQNGDLLQVNGSMYNEEIRIVMSKKTNNITFPSRQVQVVTQSNIKVLSTIRTQ